MIGLVWRRALLVYFSLFLIIFVFCVFCVFMSSFVPQPNTLSPDRLADKIFSPFQDSHFFNNQLNISKYYHQSNFFNIVRNQPDSSRLSTIHFNSRSIFKNLDQIKNLLFSLNFPFDIIAISETWLKYDNPLTQQFIANHITHKNCGGAAMYIHDSLQFSSTEDRHLESAICESIFRWNRNS